VNGRIKNWKYFAQTIPNSSLPSISDNLDIACALINRYFSPAIQHVNEGLEVAKRMRQMFREYNMLKNRLEHYESHARLSWRKYDAAHCILPPLTEIDLRNLTFVEKISLLILFAFSHHRIIPDPYGQVVYP
jgi:hypothetical protein